MMECGGGAPLAPLAERSSSGESEEACCWVCLSAGTPDEPLVSPCKCPRKCHERCLARWQLHSAGRR